MKSRHLFALTDAERRLLLRKLQPSSMDTKIESRLAKALRERLFGGTPEFTEGEIERVAYCAGDLLLGDPSAVVQHLGKHGETTVRVALDKLRKLFASPSECGMNYAEGAHCARAKHHKGEHRQFADESSEAKS